MTYPTSSDTESDWFRGTGGAGMVRVRIDAATTDVRVELRRGWRPAVGPDLLAPAVLEALHGASLARVAAEVQDRASHRLRAAAQLRPAGRPELSPHDATVRAQRARQDLREFRLQLTALAHRPRNVSGPAREVVVLALGGQVVDLALDPDWRRTATDSDLERRITAALRSGLRECAALPAQALDGCPDLVEVLADAPGGPPFPLPDQAATGLPGGR